MRVLNESFIQNTLLKIESVINEVLSYHNVNMIYKLDKRNEVFCEVIKKVKKDLKSETTYNNICKILESEQSDLSPEQSEWLSEQIYEYNQDLFLLHYFYAILYSYNYDSAIQDRVPEYHIVRFFERANQIHKKYKNLIIQKNL